MSTDPVQEAQAVTESDDVSDSTSTTSGSTTTTTTTTNTAIKTTPQPRKPNKKKDKNDPTRFEGEGINFNAKLIGIDDVPEARGDRMCQETIYRLKLSVKASGQHKQKIIVNVSEDGIKLVDLRTGVINYTHAVHKISFIARDVTDSRAFGYIYGVGDGSHKFFAIKTEKAAENLVLTLRDLFQVVYDKKRKEMDEVKQRQEDETVAEVKTEEIKPPVINDPNDGEFNQESSTDEDPVYQIPSNGTPIYAYVDSPEHIYDVPNKGKANQESLVELENELVSIEQGIEQMNKIENDFDAFGADTANTSSGSDPWGSLATGDSTAPATSASNQDSLFGSDFTETVSVPTSAQSDLQELDLFSSQPVAAKKKEEILNLFGSQPSPMPSIPPFGAAAFPGQPNPMAAPANVGGAFMGPNIPFSSQSQSFPMAPATSMANPFGAPFGNQMGQPPPVPSRPTPPAPAANPFGNDPFSSGASSGGFDAFSGGSQADTQSNNVFNENILAPVKLESAEPAAAKPKAKADAFSDLGSFGKTADTSKSPKDLFADLKSTPKKSVNELLSEKKKTDPSAGQASDEDPFGSIDSTALPAIDSTCALIPRGSNEDPFDTSFVHSNSRPINVPLPRIVMQNDSPNVNCEDFNLPYPSVPPPPLPPDTDTAPPAPPPRPNGIPTPSDVPCVPPRAVPITPPKLPPRSGNTSNCSSSAVTRPRPVPRERTSLPSSSAVLTREEMTVSKVPSDSPKELSQNQKLTSESAVFSDSAEDHNGIRSHSGSFVIEDPFIDSDPFVGTADAFSSSFDDFTCDSRTGFSSEDPFFSPVSTNSSSHTKQKKDIDCKDDPFAVFDNCLNDSFNFKNSSSRKNSRKKKSGMKGMDSLF